MCCMQSGRFLLVGNILIFPKGNQWLRDLSHGLLKTCHDENISHSEKTKDLSSKPDCMLKHNASICGNAELCQSLCVYVCLYGHFRDYLYINNY